jgi:competence protein ComEC
VLPDGTTLLIDAGGRETFGPDIGRWNPGEEIVSPYLWSRGIKRIDIAVLGGPGDENTSAMTAILRNFTVGELWHSSRMAGPGGIALINTAHERNVRICDIAAGVGEDEVKSSVQVLWPSAARTSGSLPFSDRSPVLRIAASEGSILLRGDTDDRVERILSDSENEFSSDVMESARPLSQIISEKKFLAQVDPRMVLETGGHETAGSVRRYLPVDGSISPGVPVFSTTRDGAVTIDMKGLALSVRCYGTSRAFHLQRSPDRDATTSGL